MKSFFHYIANFIPYFIVFSNDSPSSIKKDLYLVFSKHLTDRFILESIIHNALTFLSSLYLIKHLLETLININIF